MGQRTRPDEPSSEGPPGLSLATVRSGQILDWPGADKVALIVLTPFPFLAVAAYRVHRILVDASAEPYIDRGWLSWVEHAIAADLVFGVGFFFAWRWTRKHAPESSLFAGASLTFWLAALALGAYLLGHVSTPIFGGLIAVTCAVLLFFERALARRLVAFGFAAFFVPLGLTAMGTIPYGPVFRDAPFTSAHVSTAWIVSTALLAFGTALVPTLLLFGVVSRWRARDAALLDLARLDPLTRVSNRRYFFDRLGVELERARRHGTKIAVLLLDLDHFKRVNDKHGHVAGDSTLVHVARLLETDVLRRSDVIGRYGGEEFAILLPETDVEGAMIVAERCRTSIAEHPCAIDRGTRVKVTASIGVAVPGAAFDADDLMLRVDEALYRAKSKGRNRVILANSVEPPRGSDPPKSGSTSSETRALRSGTNTPPAA